VLLDQVREAVADADQAVKQGPRTTLLLFGAACIHARAVGRLEARLSGHALSRLDRDLVAQSNVSREQAVALLRATLDPMPKEERQRFWRETVEREGALQPVRRDLAQLAGRYGF
jgi:hypothetical protein